MIALVVVLMLVTSGINCTPSCDQQKMEKISECSTCCAIGGFNKFDHKKFLDEKECKCFKDQAELEFNSKPKQQVGQKPSSRRP